jgi:hypothetical protein
LAQKCSKKATGNDGDKEASLSAHNVPKKRGEFRARGNHGENEASFSARIVPKKRGAMMERKRPVFRHVIFQGNKVKWKQGPIF